MFDDKMDEGDRHRLIDAFDANYQMKGKKISKKEEKL